MNSEAEFDVLVIADKIIALETIRNFKKIMLHNGVNVLLEDVVVDKIYTKDLQTLLRIKIRRDFLKHALFQNLVSK